MYGRRTSGTVTEPSSFLKNSAQARRTCAHTSRPAVGRGQQLVFKAANAWKGVSQLTPSELTSVKSAISSKCRCKLPTDRTPNKRSRASYLWECI
eukprot:6211448-Pleurochrysis_carterae.AAC.4